MIEILIMLVVVGVTIWFTKLLLNKLFVPHSKNRIPIAKTPPALKQGSAINRNTVEAPTILQEIYNKNRKVYVFADLETTGLYVDEHKITEVAAIKYSGGDSVEYFFTLVNPSTSIPKHITNITGITDAMVSNAPRMEAVLPAFKEFVGNAELIFYNAPFDKKFLDKAASDLNSPFCNKFIDALPIAKEAFPELHDHKLTTVAKHLNVSVSGAHRALDDTRILMFVYLGCRVALLSRGQFMNATALGQALGGYSAITTNKALVEQGFQTKAKNEDDKWIYTPTTQGMTFIRLSENGRHFLWHESIIEKLDMQNFPISKKA
ncbi:3'-5' exonuclease [Alteromonas sp. ASW11-130]|uniref:3'-5' exonuclease n=1 Tax=Alteromonas sp. ASW11-130 TaxID=3015775 RepID=UPI0022418C03|nr:exonuclease domain-containing protein [Alteromonas sp. ASW11-130]MCW8092618.1 exonuclease domain-containing protein [Alteromonas sp. ASW11-130]